MINQVILKNKSEELNIPFANLLAGAMTEQVLEFIISWEKSDKMWLTNRSEIGLGAYKDVIRDKLCFVAGGDTLFSKVSADAKDLKLHIINEAAAKGFDAQISLEDYGFKVSLTVDEMRGVVNVFVENNLMKDVFPETDSLQIFTENDKSLSIKVYPIEQILSIHLMEIISKLELINDMGHYYQAYRILTSQSVNGRKVRECMASICEKNGIKFEEKPIKLIEYYRNYSYMAKKWKVQLRQIKRSDILWTDIIDCLLSFITPIWKSLETETMFLGDWMPQLKRFLD